MISLGELEKVIRETIERQARTTSSGMTLNDCDSASLARFITNVVGNLTMVVADLMESQL